MTNRLHLELILKHETSNAFKLFGVEAEMWLSPVPSDDGRGCVSLYCWPLYIHIYSHRWPIAGVKYAPGSSGSFGWVWSEWRKGTLGWQRTWVNPHRVVSDLRNRWGIRISHEDVDVGVHILDQEHEGRLIAEYGTDALIRYYCTTNPR